jgi:hypothetical protein
LYGLKGGNGGAGGGKQPPPEAGSWIQASLFSSRLVVSLGRRAKGERKREKGEGRSLSRVSLSGGEKRSFSLLSREKRSERSARAPVETTNAERRVKGSGGVDRVSSQPRRRQKV